MTTQTDWHQRAEALFQAALDLPPGQRSVFIEAEAGADPALKNEVQSLLDSYAAARNSFLDLPAHRLAAVRADAAPAPRTIGQYRIIETLGTGGMGVVYRAEQQHPLREVALKVMRPGATGRDALRRFELESSLLARLRHPGIAQVYDAGTHDDGDGPRPYFVMELVDGPSLTNFIRTHQPDTATRLELLATVCDAVQYAHQKGVIHRDLKPSNILVVATGAEPAATTAPGLQGSGSSRLSALPKILDFGVARATDSDIVATTMHTSVGQVVGTLPYMSPEQVTGETRDIDTRTDVYALGVILYEALTGRLPIDVGNKTIAAAAQVIGAQEPPPLSSIDRSFRGDLNTMVLKALEKDPERRYQSASDFASDLRRFLRNEPIAARRTTTIYQLRKFARRNRGLVGGVIAAFVVLVIGGVVSTSLAISRTRALADSERQREIAQAVNDFLNNDLLGQANPYVGAAHDAKLRDVLDSAAKAIETRFLDKPVVQASIRATLGKTYFQLSAYDQVEKLLLPAIVIYERELGTNDPRAHELRHLRIMAHLQAFRIAEAEILLNEQLAVLSERFGTSAVTAQAQGDLGILRKRQGRFTDSEMAYRRALEIYAALPEPPQSKIAITKQNLGLVLFDQQKNAEAEALLREAADDFEKQDGADSANVAYALTNLGQIYKKSRPKAEGFRLAQECFDRAYDIRRRRLGEDHRETLRTRGCIALLLHEEGDYMNAELIQRDVLERRLRVMEPDHIDVLDSRFYVGKAVEHQGRHAEAIELYRLSIQAGQARFGPEYYHVRRFRWGLAALLRQSDDQAGLHEFFEDYFAALEMATVPPDAKPADLNAYAYWLLNCDTECLRNPEKALVLARRAYEIGAPNDKDIPHTFAAALAENGQSGQAVIVLEKALEALAPDAAPQRKEIEEQLATIRSALWAGGSAGR